MQTIFDLVIDENTIPQFDLLKQIFVRNFRKHFWGFASVFTEPQAQIYWGQTGDLCILRRLNSAHNPIYFILLFFVCLFVFSNVLEQIH